MAKEALKVEETEELEELEVPTGGIGDFVMDDDELEAAYGDDSETDAKEEFGDNGIAQFPALAERMAKYGRNEDNMLAHVAEGELVIPAQFLEDEVMKQRIYDILTEAGVEDPEAYVVGAEANDLNPTTGLPEFFLKKLFKGIGKAIKKVVKAVVKVVKKVAPIILPIALAFTPLGPIYGAAMGSGIGTLLNGGSIKDALKSALISGAVGGVTAGFTGSGSFTQNISDAASGFGARVSQTVSGAGSTFTGGGFTGEGNLFSDYVPTPGAEVAAAGDAGVTEVIDPNAPAQGSVDAGAANPPIEGSQVVGEGGVQQGTQLSTGSGEVAERSFLEKTSDNMFRAGQTPAEVASAAGNAETAYLAKMEAAGIVPTEAGLNAAVADAAPKLLGSSMLAKYGPTALAGTALAGGAGFFDVPEIEQANFIDYNPDGTPTTGRDLIDADPGKYLVHNLGQLQLNQETGEYEAVANQTAFEEEDLVGYAPPEQVAVLPPQNQQNYLTASTPGGPFARPYVTAEEGGPIFPRRTGGIAPTEGTPGEDSVRAMLMPGEFVMTTDAVRGLGNGNLNNGIQNMYSVMRNLESRGRATA